MPDTYISCDKCKGRRYGAEIEDLLWNGKSIADVLKMSFEEAAKFFSFHTQLSGLMQLMVETGLGYIKLGQYSPTLSGGEAQRLKLVSELAKGCLVTRNGNTTKAASLHFRRAFYWSTLKRCRTIDRTPPPPSRQVTLSL